LSWRGVCLGGWGLWFGAEARTNNVAEALGMLHGMRWLQDEWGWLLKEAGHVLVMGDSHLVISFLRREAVPSRRELVLATREAHDLVRSWQGVRVTYQHVPRERNQWADWLARQAHAHARDIPLGALVQDVAEGDSPPADLHPDAHEEHPTAATLAALAVHHGRGDLVATATEVGESGGSAERVC